MKQLQNAEKPALTRRLVKQILDRQMDADDYDIGTRELLPKELLELIPSLKSTERQRDPLCVLRLFHAATGSEWLVMAGARQGDDFILFVRAMLGGAEDMAELGYQSYRELNDIRHWGRVEVDALFGPIRLSRWLAGDGYPPFEPGEAGALDSEEVAS